MPNAVGKNCKTKVKAKHKCHGVITSQSLSCLTDMILFKKTLTLKPVGGSYILFTTHASALGYTHILREIRGSKQRMKEYDKVAY